MQTSTFKKRSLPYDNAGPSSLKTNNARFSFWARPFLFQAVLILLLSILFSGEIGAQGFVHPGGLHSQEDLDRMKTKVTEGAHPWIDGWNGLIQDPKAQSTWRASPRADMNLRQVMSRDGDAAYLNAIRWYISGDSTHAECAIRIFNDYSSTVNQIPSYGVTDIYGLGGIGIAKLAMAAEIMRLYDGWESDDFDAFKEMMVNYFYPVCHDFLTNHNGRCVDYYWTNWDANNIGALIAMGVVCDNQEIFDEGIEYFKNGKGTGSIKKAVPFVHGDLGQWQETGRDQSHGFLGVGLLGTACQVAWNQGIDLYGYDDNRLLKGAEYVAKYNLWEDVPFSTYDNCQILNNKWPSINGRGRYFDRPVYEMIYNHYIVRQGLSAPYTQKMAGIMRPEGGSIDHFGYGTLTFTREPSTLPAYPVPPAPADITATAGVGRVFVKWKPSEGNTINGYQVQRATSSGGPYETVATWNTQTDAQYRDTDVTSGTTYYYRIAGVNRAGTGENSIASNGAIPVDAGDLPTGWARVNIGDGATGSSGYADVTEGAYEMTHSGTNIGGTADDFGFTYTTISGDATITARISEGGWFGKVGLMIRESLAPDARMVARVLGDGGGRHASMYTRDTEGGGSSNIWGNTYTWVPAWFRIERVGNTFTTYESADGITWFTIGSSTVAMDSTVYIGMSAYSGSTTRQTTTIYDHVSVVSEGTTPPAIPANFKATPGNTQAFLSWDSLSNASSYSVKRATISGGPYTTVATGLTEGSFTDTGLENETTYYYIVNAANFAGESENSAEVSVTAVLMLPPVPVTVKAVPVSEAQIDLSWEASLSAESYNIKRSETDGGPYTTIASPTTTAYSDTNVVSSTTYYYVISAINEIGETDNSSQAHAIPGRAGYWKFDETAGSTANDSWGNGDGTLSSGATFTAGVIDNAVSLDGSDGYVTLPEGIVSSLTDFSISAWVKFDRLDTWARVFDFGSGQGNYMFLTANKNGGGLRYSITTGEAEQQINTSGTLAANKWYHLAVTQSGTTAILYLDGVEVGRNTDMALNPSNLGNTNQNWIGKSQWPDPLLAGQVDDFKIFSKALSADEVADMAFVKLPPAAPKDLSFVAGNSQITVSWSGPGGDSYNVKRATGIEGPFELIANVTDTGYTDTDVVSCENFFYTVTTLNELGESENSSPSGPSLGSKLTGTLIGTDGSWGNNPATTKAAAVDGNLASFFDAPDGSGWVGYDLGEDGEKVITRLRYAPRPDTPDRMVEGVFQAANTADFSDADTLFKVVETPDEGVLTEQVISNSTAYRYVRYLSPADGFGNIAEVEFLGLAPALPEFSSDSLVEGTYDSTFYYLPVVSNMPKEFIAAGLPDGLSIDTCTGVISGVPKASGTFPVTITAINYYGSGTDNVEIVIKKNQTISFSSLPAKHIGDADFALNAVASSGLPVTYSSSDTTVAEIIGDSIRITGIGSADITAHQDGDSLYRAAEPVAQTFTVQPLDIRVLHKDGDHGNTANNSIRPYLQIKNDDMTSVAYGEISVRYWFTAENFAGINTWIDYAQLGNGNISMNYVSLPAPHEGAYGYIEYEFDASLGDLLPGAGSGPIRSRFTNTDWSDLEETDDHSFQPSTSYAENEQITLYRNGQLVWGTEPLPVTPELKVKVYSENRNANTGTNQIHTLLKLNNEGNVPVDYKDLSIRYWFTKDTEAELEYRVDYADLDGANISGQFVALDPAVPGADTYFEISIDPAAGTFYPLSNTGKTEYHISKSDWSRFDESDDYSYVPKAPFAENGHITVYYQGELVYGTEPAEQKALTTSSLRDEKSDDYPGMIGPMDINIYPNPAADKVTISLAAPLEHASLLVHNSQGRLIRIEKVSGQEYTLDLSTAPQGVYILTLTSSRSSVVRKIVKK